MNTILNIISEDKSVKQIAHCIEKKTNAVVYGLADSLKAATFAVAVQNKPLIIVTPDSKTLEAWRIDLQSLLPKVEICILPELDFFEVHAVARSLDLYAKRISILTRLLKGENIIVLSTASAAAKSIVSPDIFVKEQFCISVNDVIEREKFIEILNNYGYQRCGEVDRIGDFSVRGGIIDIFPVNASDPIRIEFFDNNVESIRIFNINNKRSFAKSSTAYIMPLTVIDNSTDEVCAFTSYINGGVTVFDEPTRIIDNINRLMHENETKNIVTFKQMSSIKNGDSIFFVSFLPRKVEGVTTRKRIDFNTNMVPSFQRHLDLIIPELNRWISGGSRIFFVLDDKKLKRVSDFLLQNDIHSANISFVQGALNCGFILPSSNVIVITETEIFGQIHHKNVSASTKKTQEDFFKDISIGDYVVHINHGIGKFLGIVSMDVGGVIRDYMHIQYHGADKLFLPTDQIHYVHKYISIGDTIPHLSRLNTADWTRAKTKAKTAVEDIANKLVDIYARRLHAEGFAFNADDALQAEFEDACEFELTDDQAKTLAEVKADMESNQPMDRLICGDVGFGKTEIAIRAAFKAAMNGKQVALLVPTTVLAQQHFQTFKKRFDGFLPTIDLLSRFRTTAQQNETLKQLKNGNIDILIGTHAILNSNKVVFKDLGLLIIDEEQRFGVKQKDRFRDLASGVDVLSLSATPIPRSLHMSLVGARDLSVIETPPAERVPVQTYVAESDDNIIIEAIRRELSRNGQVFFVHNRVEDIDLIRDWLQELVPEARIMTAHGQMHTELLEQIMMDFYAGKFDILIATSIVENGLDIPNANTLIVHNADYFGLSQLYQLRGRVGRSSRLAFAYFLFNPDKVLTSAADKRLQAIKDFAQLGSSFGIAMRDLQIRGAGNLLGSQQHGHIAGVGFAMYSHLLQQAVEKLRQNENDKSLTQIVEEQVEEFTPTLTFHIDAYFDDNFIADSHIKLNFYQRLTNTDSVQEVMSINRELLDRFGKLPDTAQNLINLTRIKILAKQLKISSIVEREGQVIFQPSNETKFKPANALHLTKRFKGNFILQPNKNMFLLKITPDIKKRLLIAVIFILETLAKK